MVGGSSGTRTHDEFLLAKQVQSPLCHAPKGVAFAYGRSDGNSERGRFLMASRPLSCHFWYPTGESNTDLEFRKLSPYPLD